jgi:CRISPR/Cas system CSM-associated protein Csm4 (group 5 of RAMP superfamily)
VFGASHHSHVACRAHAAVVFRVSWVSKNSIHQRPQIQEENTTIHKSRRQKQKKKKKKKNFFFFFFFFDFVSKEREETREVSVKHNTREHKQKQENKRMQ